MGGHLSFKEILIPLILTVLAGLSTGIGSLTALFIKDFKKSYLEFSLGLSAGVMIYVSFVELLGASIKEIGFLYGNLAFFTGIFFIMLIDYLIPHDYIEEHAKGNFKDKKLLSAAMMTMLGIAIHNFPEGLAVFMSSLGDIKLGMALAVAIAIHNIPEGIAVAMPIYYATKSRKKAFWYSLLSGIAEPIGALVGALLFAPFLSQALMSFLLAFVGGIMIFISFDELLPLAFQHKESHIAISGIIIGMLVMALSLHLL